ncbi:MAG: response regulator receiver protein, partial [Atopobium sp.]|nr:response regulator receiver protein [Atopobium sp.]
MAFDPVKEDYQRLILRFARTQVSDEDSIATLMKDFNWRFSNDRDSLPQTDEDRAFNLVAQAAEIVDYRLPFVEESQA